MVGVVSVLLFGILQPTSATSSSQDGNDYVQRINALRSSVGAQPLLVDGELNGLAQRCAERIAAAGALVHTSDLAAGVSAHWTKLGENIGTGTDNASIWSAFLHSAQHYGNLVNPAYNRVGVGVAHGGGNQWTCHRFMAVSGGGDQPAAARSSAAPAPSDGASSSRRSAPATSSAPDPDPAPAVVAPPRPIAGPPPPADAARVSAVLSALRSLTTDATASAVGGIDADRVSAVLSAMHLLSSTPSGTGSPGPDPSGVPPGPT
jgi:hypothetical protein